MTSLFRSIATAFVSACISCASFAQEFPTRTVTVVVPYGPGGGTDMFGRAFAADLAARIGQSVVVENVPGAGGTIGIQKVMAAAADGYTLVVGNGIELEMLEMADPQNARGRITDLTPVALFGTQPMVLVARTGLDFKSVDDVVKASKAKPGSLTLASSGPGTILHIAGEIIKKSAGVQMVDVPYKGAPQIAVDLIAGNVDTAVMAIPSVKAHVQSGKLSALGVTDSVRSRALPDVPSLNESNSVKGIDTKVWYGIFGPPSLPTSVVRYLEKHSAAIAADPAFQQKLLQLAMTPPKEGTAQELEDLRTSQLKAFRDALGGNSGKK